MIRDPWLRALVAVTCAIASIYFIGLVWQVAQQFADIVLLFFLAWLLAFVLEPVVAALIEKGHLPRVVAIGATYATLLVVLTSAIVLLVPALAEQVGQIVRSLPEYVQQVTKWVMDGEESINAWLLERNSPIKMDVGSALNPQELSRRIEALGLPLLNNAFQVATGLLTILVELVLVLILSFYFMVDGSRIGETLVRSLPLRAQDDARYLMANVHRAFAGFLRGQVIQALLSGIGTGVVMAALNVQYALLASMVSGIVLLIPFLGPVLALWLPVTIAIFTQPGAVVVLFVVLLAWQQVIFNVLAPRIMSQQVGLHPLLVFFAVLAGARVAGIWGAIFGVPVVAVAATMVSFYRATQEERLERLQQQLPGQELVSVEAEGEAAVSRPAAASVSSAQPPTSAVERREAHIS